MTSVTNNTTPNRQRSKATPYMPSYMGEGQTCVVCGDLATGLHYRAITCEGCKGFFRRTSQRHLEYECKGNEQCEVNKHTRNVCQRCRYIKCINAGMSTDLVLNEVERVQKRELIKGNRERRKLESHLSALKSPIRDHNELLEEVNRITSAFCKLVDQTPTTPSELSPTNGDHSPSSADSRLAALIRPIVHRNTLFAQNLPVWLHLPVSAQSQLLHESLLEVQLLRFLSFFDVKDKIFRFPCGAIFEQQHLLDLIALDIEDDNEDLQRLVHWMFRFGGALAEMELNEQELALISALLIFNPDHLDLAMSGVLSHTSKQLYEMLFALTEDISDDDVHNRWAVLVNRIYQIRTMSSRIAPFVEEKISTNSTFEGRGFEPTSGRRICAK